MAGQRQKKTESQTDETVVENAPETTAEVEELKSDLDDILDEIDGVLETNAEEFVRSYVQKGGQ